MNLELGKKLSNASGIAGFEQSIMEIVKEELKDYEDTFEYDNLGSLITKATGKENGPKIMLAAHMDEVGFLIKRIDENGFLKFSPVGGWWDQVLLGQKVKVVTSEGKEFVGVIGSKPPHILPKEQRDKLVEIKDMYIDLGAKSKEQVEACGIKMGDMIVPDSIALDMIEDDFIMGKAWDDRIGVLVLIEVMKKLKTIQHPNIVYGVATVQEEIGLRGAKTAAAKVKPDIGFALDTGVAGDTPGVTADESDSKIGGGPQVTIMDAGMIINPALKQYIFKVAKDANIDIQPEILLGGATDAANIQLTEAGVPSTCISLATRYLHAHNSIISKKDVDQTIELVLALIENLNEEEVAKIINK